MKRASNSLISVRALYLTFQLTHDRGKKYCRSSWLKFCKSSHCSLEQKAATYLPISLADPLAFPGGPDVQLSGIRFEALESLKQKHPKSKHKLQKRPRAGHKGFSANSSFCYER